MEFILTKIIKQLSNHGAIIIATIYFFVGILTLPSYGINWDTINHLPRGQAYLNYFFTGHQDYNNLPEWFDYWQDPTSLFIKTNTNKLPERSFYQNDATPFTWYMENDGGGHPPLSDILSSVFNLILFQKIHLINDIDSYRVYGIFLASLLIFVLYKWVGTVYGKVAGFIASLSLALYPLFWSESHFNTEKDIPETVFWSLAIFATWKAFTGKSCWWFVLLGLYLGLALGTKFNVLFLPFVLIPWLAVYLYKRRVQIPKIKYGLGSLLAPIIALSIFISSWPYLWPDPVNRIKGVLNFYKVIGTTSNINSNFVGPFGSNTYPIQWIIYITPVVILIFAVIGILIGILKLKTEKDKISLLFLLWLIVPILRVSAPGATVYGGIRQIMEYVPALAVFSGLGGSAVYYWIKQLLKAVLKSKKASAVAAFVVIILLFCPLIYRLITIHPNENVYFNSLVGGLLGAEERNMPAWGNSFGAAYRQGVRWINENAEPNSKVAFGHELIPNIPGIWFRPDLIVHNTFRSGELKKGEYIISLTYEGTENTAYFDQYLDKAIEPVYEVKVDDISILKVWKNDLKNTNKQYLKKEQITDFQIQKGNSVIKIDIGRLVNLAQLEASFINDNCANLKSAQVKISQNNKDWKTMPGRMPGEDWNVPQLGQQPLDNYFMVPFVADKARYIQVVYTPEDACIKNISTSSISIFPDF